MGQGDQELLIGRIAVHNRLITMDQLAEATMEQGRSGGAKRLGDILVEQGFITPAQLQKLVQAQKDYLSRRQSARPGAPGAGGATGTERAGVRGAAGARVAGAAIAGPAAGAAAASPPGPAGGQVFPAPHASPAVVTAAPANPRLDELLARAVAERASDVHVHAGAPIRMRVNGRLTEAFPTPLSRADTESLLLPSLDDEQRRAFEERGELDFAYTLPGVGRFRANIYRQLRGVDAAFRAIPPQPPSLADLGLPMALARLTNFHQGMVLITGPAGCGKSTTLAALLNIINEERRDHILSIEDPIEVLHASKRCVVNQRQVGQHTGSFARALRAALREDPDVVAIGELRDLETISLAITAAETGHLVMATLHTNNATRTINRVLGVFPPDQQPQIRAMISESLRAVVSQRLVPTADGRGRVAALEVLLCNKAVGNLIRDDKTFQIRSVLQIGQAQGMCLLDGSLAALVKAGTITREEALRNCEDPKRFAAHA